MKTTVWASLAISLAVTISAGIASAKPSANPSSPGPANHNSSTTVGAHQKPDQAKPKTVGWCTTAKSCKRLKLACGDAGYDYQSSNPQGTKGTCQTRKQISGIDSLAILPNDSHSALCRDKVLCQKLKARCHGSTWSQNGQIQKCSD